MFYESHPADLVIYDPHAQKDQCCYDDVRHQKYYFLLHLYVFFPAVRIVTAVCGNNSIIPEKSR